MADTDPQGRLLPGQYPPQSPPPATQEEDSGVLYCFSGDDPDDEECKEYNDASNGSEADQARIMARRNKPYAFQTNMAKAFCAEPLCCVGTCITCTYGTSWCLRREVLQNHSKFMDNLPSDTARYGRVPHKDFWRHYMCCQGFSPCLQEQLNGCTGTCDPNAKACLACCECCCCAGCSIGGSRAHVMKEYGFKADKTDNQLIRFNNCMQALACICTIMACFCKGLKDCARCVRIIADIVFCCIAGCMAAQVHHEIKYQEKMFDDETEHTRLLPPIQGNAAPGAHNIPPPPPVPPPPPPADGQSQPSSTNNQP